MYNLDYVFLTGKKIDLDCGLKINQYTFEEIMEDGIGYKEYESLIWSLTRYPYEFKLDLEDVGIDYKSLNSYDIFVMLSRELDIDILKRRLDFLFDDSFELVDGFFVSKNGVLNNSSIEEIKEVLSKMLFLKKPKERKPANDEAKKLIKKQIKMQQNKKVAHDIYSIMYSLINSKNSNETYDTICKRTPHQIYASYLHIQKHKDFDNTMNGIYSGVIKSSDVSFDKINWINKVN